MKYTTKAERKRDKVLRSIYAVKTQRCEQGEKREALPQGVYNEVHDQGTTQARQSIAKHICVLKF